MSEAPPNFTVKTPRDVQQGFLSWANGVLQNSDLAVRRDPALQRQMRHDPDVMSPLLQRQMAVALLPWSIVPEDEDEQRQVDQAEELRNGLEKTRRWADFLRHLMDALWYGPSAVNPIFERDRGIVRPGKWVPIHGDTIVYDEFGSLGLRVGASFDGEKQQSNQGWVHILKDLDRRSVVAHTHNPTGADYQIPEEARYQYAGRGLRDLLWYQWLIKQNALQLWVRYLERYAMGFRVGKYPDGNAAAQEAMQDTMARAAGDVNISIPDTGPDQPGYDFTLLESNGQGAGSYGNLIEGYLAGQIKEMIIGQTATTEATATGLGSDVGTRHAETFQRIIRFDALALEDTLTEELVRPMHAMSFGETDWKPRFRFTVEEVDPEQFMEAVKLAHEIGLKIAERDVREQMGLREPAEDEPVIERQRDELGGFGGPFSSDETVDAFTAESSRQLRLAFGG